MTPIFDQLVRELGFVENSELPAVRYEPEPTFGYTIDHLMALKAALVRYQERHRLPVPPDAPYHVNCDNHSLQKVTIQPSSDMVKRCLPSKETCMTHDEIPGGQEHGVIIPPERIEKQRFLALMGRNPDWVQRYNFDDPTLFEFEHKDLRGFKAQFSPSGELESVQYFDAGQPTSVIADGDDFTTLTTAICSRAYWAEHVRRVEGENEADAESIRRAQENPDQVSMEEAFVDLETEQAEVERMAENAETRRLDELAAEEAERLADEADPWRDGAQERMEARRQRVIQSTQEPLAEEESGLPLNAKLWMPGDPPTGSVLHEHSDGKFLNPGAVIANRHHATEETEVVESGGAIFRRNPATGAVSMSTNAKTPVFQLPPDVLTRVQEQVEEARSKLSKALGVDIPPVAVAEEQQPASVYPTGPEHEILREAAATISSGRQDDYGHAEDSFATIAGMWETYLSARFGEPVEIDGRDVAMMMSLLKVARDAASRKRDNLVDLVGYAALAERTVGSDR